MTKTRLMAVLVLSALLSACGGADSLVVQCNDDLQYQDIGVGKRVVAPEGLDQLNEFAEMPIPKADPEAPRIPEGRCYDQPPTL